MISYDHYRVNLNSIELLTENFYRWEVRGRGWNVWDTPVHLEPPFIPFRFSHTHQTAAIADDGRKSTFISTFIDKFKSGFNSQPLSQYPNVTETEKEECPIPFIEDSDIREFKIILPLDAEISREYSEHFLLTLSSCALPVSYEIVGTKEEIYIHFSCREGDSIFVQQQIKSFFPEAIFTESDSVKKLLEANQYFVVIDCGLSEEFMRPVKTFKQFNPDPLTTIYGALENLGADDIGMVQILFQSAEASWASNIMRSVRNDDGSCFFIDAPEMLKLAENKISKPLYSVILRIVGKGRSQERSLEIVKNLFKGLSSFTEPLSNEFVPLENDNYDEPKHLEDVIYRRTHRSGMILNSEELLGLVHFPSPLINSEKINRDRKKSREVPSIAQGNDFILGENIHRNKITQVSLSTEQRLRHIHIIGKTGTGKSTLLVNMVKQDIEASRGVAVLDPHGDLIDRITGCISENRLKDVILFDPSDTEYPVGFNILEAHSEIEKTVLSSDLVELFRRFSTSWGDQMTAVLANAVTAFVESESGGTLVDLKRFLLERDFRNQILKQGVDPSITYFWEKEFPLLRGGSQVSIITRLDAFLRSKVIRNIVIQKKGLDFKGIVESGKIFLAKLSQGIIGDENSYLLGSLICSKFHQIAMGRQAMDVSERTPFFLYIDEFQNFATPSLVSTLSSSRKYSMGLIMAQQSLHQIENTILFNSVIANPATRICFSLGDNDAQKLSLGFAHYDTNDLMNLGVGEAIARIERNEYDCNVNTFDISEVTSQVLAMRREEIIALTRDKYGKKILPTEIQTPPSDKSETVFPIVTKRVSPVPTEVRQEQCIPPNRREETETKPKRVLPKVSIPSDELINRKVLSQHRYLQTLIKKMAEQRGYRAVIEEPTPDGNGRVDVGLECDGKKIAVEISVTTGDTQELHNIEKCLRAGYDPVIVCSPEKKNLEAIRKLMMEKLPLADQSKVLLFEPEELFFFLDQEAAKEATREERVKGYRVKINYKAVTESEKISKRDMVAQVIIQSLRRIEK